MIVAAGINEKAQEDFYNLRSGYGEAKSFRQAMSIFKECSRLYSHLTLVTRKDFARDFELVLSKAETFLEAYEATILVRDLCVRDPEGRHDRNLLIVRASRRSLDLAISCQECEDLEMIIRNSDSDFDNRKLIRDIYLAAAYHLTRELG